MLVLFTLSNTVPEIENNLSAGIFEVIKVIPSQSAKAKSPMWDTEAGITTLVKFLQPSQALSFNDLTVSGITNSPVVPAGTAISSDISFE